MSPYTGPRCHLCGGLNTYTDTHPARPARVHCLDCNPKLREYRAGRPPAPEPDPELCAALQRAREAVAGSDGWCMIGRDPAVWIRTEDLAKILDALDPVSAPDPGSCIRCGGTGMPPADYKPEPDLVHAWDGHPPCPDCDGRGRCE